MKLPAHSSLGIRAPLLNSENSKNHPSDLSCTKRLPQLSLPSSTFPTATDPRSARVPYLVWTFWKKYIRAGNKHKDDLFKRTFNREETEAMKKWPKLGCNHDVLQSDSRLPCWAQHLCTQPTETEASEQPFHTGSPDLKRPSTRPLRTAPYEQVKLDKGKEKTQNKTSGPSPVSDLKIWVAEANFKGSTLLHIKIWMLVLETR